MDRLKVGIIGTGFSAQAQMEAIKRLHNAEITAIAASSMEKAEQMAKACGIPAWYDDAYALINDPEVEVIHNCTPNYLHFPLNKAALLAGKHLLSEKPLALNSKESAELAELAKHAKGVSGVCFNYRHYPLVAHLKEAISTEEYGKSFLVSGGYCQDWLLYNTDCNWRMQTEQNGVSRAIADIGSHWCDLLQYITGQNIVELCADLQTVHPVRYQTKRLADGKKAVEPVSVSTEDFGSVLVRFDGGLRGAFTVSQVSAGRKNRLHFEIAAEKACLAWDQEEPNRLWVGRRDEQNGELVRDAALLSPFAGLLTHYPGGHQEGWPDALKNLIQQFYDAVIRKKAGTVNAEASHVASFEQGHRIMQVVDAIMESSRTGRWVSIPAFATAQQS
ncbi:Gfo/Idh/MocA family protein [Paenibacillus abyssi]|uniref:Dehydrogenase n=1 Tax=Paenibacillus abyssi TaxID=1340531 RepID=A0A917LG09_9BACL|nr:Gfo/Idh/MocA family oxidoreductase [Paenibacillus abyssi]GGG19274.1 dehydrogenase [Paenibacillus abyssi]